MRSDHLPLLTLCGITAAVLGAPLGPPLAGDADPRRSPSARFVATDPASAAVAATTASNRIDRADDGLFYVQARVNRTTVRFVVDTGASVMVLTKADAARIGLAAGVATDRLQTVSGTTAMRWASVDRVELAGHRLGGIDAALPDADMKTSLLGQNVLTQLGGVSLEGDVLTLR